MMTRFRVVITVFVDKPETMGSTEGAVNWVNDKLRSLFNVMDFREMSYYLDVLFER